jgi:hypothetical protein
MIMDTDRRLLCRRVRIKGVKRYLLATPTIRQGEAIGLLVEPVE